MCQKVIVVLTTAGLVPAAGTGLGALVAGAVAGWAGVGLPGPTGAGTVVDAGACVGGAGACVGAGAGACVGALAAALAGAGGVGLGAPPQADSSGAATRNAAPPQARSHPRRLIS